MSDGMGGMETPLIESSCTTDWVEIEGAETYRIATTADNAFSSSAQDTSIGTTMKQEIKKYAEEWKTLYKPSREKTSTHLYA